MSDLSEGRQRIRVGYVLKKYPRLSETFIVNEILGVEGEGVDLSIFSLRQPDEGHFHANLSAVRGAVTYLPLFKSQSALEAMRELARLGPSAPENLQRAFSFVDQLPEGQRPQLLLQALHLVRGIRRERIQHLHAHFMTIAARVAYLAHLFTGVSFSVTAHAKDIYRHTVDRRVFREVARAAHAIVTVCDANASWIQEELLGESPARVERIYNGIPEDFCRVEGEERRPGLIIGVGRLVEKKGFAVLLDACQLLKQRGLEFQCLVIGDGDRRQALAEQRRELALEEYVLFPGPLPRDEIMRWMSRARVLAAPCIMGEDGNRDALPTVLIEAMAAGLPVVSTPLSGIPEIVAQDVEGLLVPEGQADALADALQRTLTDASLWSRFSRAGPAKVRQRFDRKQTVPRLVGLFAEACQTSGSLRAGVP